MKRPALNVVFLIPSFFCLWLQPTMGFPDDAVVSGITPEERKQLEERDVSSLDSIKYRATGDLEKAVAAVENVVSIERRVLGDKRISPIGFLERWFRYSTDNGSTEGTREVLNSIVAAKSREPVSLKWETDHLKRLISDLDKTENWTPEKRVQLRECGKLVAEVLLLRNSGDWKSASVKAGQVHDLRIELWGRSHPEIGISLYSRGVIASSLGEFDKSETLLLQATELLEREVGSQHPYCAMCRLALFRTRWSLQKLDEALKEVQTALKIYEASEGPTSDGYFECIGLLSDFYSSRTLYAEALNVLEQSLPQYRRTYGERSHRFAGELFRVGLLQLQLKSTQNACQSWERAVVIFRELKAVDDPIYLQTISNLGFLEGNEGHVQKAELLLRESLAGSRRVYGEQSLGVADATLQLANFLINHGTDATTKGEGAELAKSASHLFQKMGADGRLGRCQALNLLGMHYFFAQETDLAVKVFEELIPLAKETFGERSTEVADISSRVANMLFLGKQDGKAAEPHYRHAIDSYISLNATNTKAFVSLLSNLGLLYSSAKDSKNAEAIYRECLESSDKLSGETSVESAVIAANLGSTLVLTEKADEAEKMFRRSLPILRKAGKRYRNQLVFTHSELGQLLSRQKRHREAIHELREALRLAKTEFKERDPVVIVTAASLVDSLTQEGFEQMTKDILSTKRMFVEAVGIREFVYGDQSAEYAIGQSNLGSVCAVLGEQQQAKNHFLKSLEIKKRTFGESSVPYAWDSVQLANTETQLREFDAASNQFAFARQVFEKIPGREREIGLIDRGEALLSSMKGEHLEAKQRWTAALNREKKSPHRDNTCLFICLKSLAVTNETLMTFDDAVADYQDALELCRKLYGESNPEFAEILERLGFVEFARGKYKLADQHYDQACQVRTRIIPENRLAQAASLRAWSDVKRKLEQDEAADELLSSAEKLAKAEGERGLKELAQCLQCRGRDLGARGDVEGAVELLNQSVELCRKAGGTNDEQYFNALQMLALNCNVLGDYGRALDAIKQCVDLKRESSGIDSVGFGRVLKSLATIYQSKGDYEDAEKAYRQSQQILEAKLGRDSVEVVSIQESLSGLHGIQGRREDAIREICAVAARYQERFGRDSVQYARAMSLLGSQYIAAAAYDLAEKPLLDSLEIQRRLTGERSDSVASALETLGDLYSAKGDTEKAQSYTNQSLEIRRASVGRRDRRLADSLDKFATKSMRIDFTRAESALLESLQIRAQLLGKRHREYATSLHHLGVLYSTRGQAFRASSYLESALEIRKTLQGVNVAADVASTSASLGSCYMQLDRLSDAETLLLSSIEIQCELKGEHRAAYAATLQMLGTLYAQLGDWELAKSYLEKALSVVRETYGEDHYLSSFMELGYAMILLQRKQFDEALPITKRCDERIRLATGDESLIRLTSLFLLYVSFDGSGMTAEAEQAISQAILIGRKQSQGPYPYLTFSLMMAGNLAQKTGDFQKADQLLTESLHLTDVAIGKAHPGYAQVLQQKASLLYAEGRLKEAGAVYDEVLTTQQRIMELAFDILSERQQFAMKLAFSNQLNDYLSLGDNVPVEQAYQHVFASKGAVLMRQMRLHHDPPLAELVPVNAELQDIVGRLCAVAYSARTLSPSDRKNINDWTQRKEELEKILAKRSASFQKRRAIETLTPAELVESLPDGAALIDFVEYQRTTTIPGNAKVINDKRLAAFVLRRGKPIVRIELNESGPVKEAIERWRIEFSSDLATKIRKLVWEPLESNVNDCSLIILSLDGPLHRFPWAALPAQKSGQYLIEEKSIVSIIAPQLAAEFTATTLTDNNSEIEQKPRGDTLLIVGDVDFDNSSNPPANGEKLSVVLSERNRNLDRFSRSALRSFGKLDGTKDEVSRIHRLWSELSKGQTRGDLPLKINMLSGRAATEQAIHDGCPIASHVHLATHGFFDPELRSDALDFMPTAIPSVPLTPEFDSFGLNFVKFNPSISSGVALAGANRNQKDAIYLKESDDGILSALEVQGLDLRQAQLVVLSACETGLGVDASGEGVVGLQRAFHASGAKRVIGTLWKVPDRATEQLMLRFYENLWREGMSPIKALQEAQVWMLRQGMRQPDLVRGLALPEDAVPIGSADELHPYFWASFVFSGNWN